ncbi:cell division protein FtsA [Candidatus Marinarcus aquaticus]|uniref:Cell division protein FtsA n=1 Tax=Candidatus Marinarcus aquaticus TaxID=2044504 RepID=A0A4Q0XSF6_9BACT|nr:cell division protein FtsA [Candidatus Marinarcus aquaticus]RXJ60242.1 cell division protein FtsA [Candidatus Marinarcus aquaticus]
MSDTILAIDIGSSSITAVIAQNDLNNKINILGAKVEESEGINKGLITNIEVASEAIKEAVKSVDEGTASKIDSTYVSISAAYTKGVRSSGSVNVPNGQITQTEINQVLQMALYNATIVPEYDVVHVLPIYYKVDDSQLIDNPLNMNGARLEVAVYIVTAKKTALTNIKSALKSSNLEIKNFVLSGYASAIAVLNEEQKRFGAAILDIGGSTTDIVCFKGKSIVYNDFLPVGSMNITNDLSIMLRTPPNAAETIKMKYANLHSGSASGHEDESTIKKIKIPIIGDEQNTKEMPLDSVQTIIHARVEEILVLAKERIKKSGISDSLGAGIVITGGMSQLPGIKELAELIFDNMPVKISNPVNIRNGYMSFDDPTMSTIVGLLLYGLDPNPSYELDSNKQLRYKKEIQQPKAAQEQAKQAPTQTVSSQEEQTDALPTISKKDKAKGVSKFWNKVAEWF